MCAALSEPTINVLLLEDSREDAALLSERLRRDGLAADVDRVCTRAAFERGLARGPDIILADYSVPGFDALEALQLAKDALPHTPIIIVSGALGEERATAVLRGGATDYVLKDRLDRLVPSIERALADARRRREHRGAQARTRAIVEATLDAIVAMDERGIITEFNAAAEQTFGWSREQVIGRVMADLLVPDRWRARHDAAIARYVETGEGSVIGRRVELSAMRADGAEFPIDIAIVPMASEDGALSFTAFIRDITDRRRIEEERRELLRREQDARTEAEAANRAKDEFLAVLSHELRTPLSSILGWAQLLEGDPGDPTKVRRAAEVIIRNAKAQARLVDDILDVSRIVSGKLQLDIQHLEDATPIIDAAVNALSLAAADKGVTLETKLAPVGPLPCDPVRLQQITWNLVSNGIKFTPPGGHVAVECARAGEELRLVVRDDGRGIRPEFLPHLFERFRQEDASSRRAHGGLGLGLALVRHLTELHGGRAVAASAGPGRGATFTVSLPLGPMTLVGGGREQTEPSPVEVLAGKAILIVEDDADTREVLTALMRADAGQVRAVATAFEALDAIQERSPDVLISDIGLPGEDGYTLIRRVRALPSGRGGDVPALALTAFAGADERRRAYEAGFDAHLAKPASAADLLVAISRLLEARARR